MFEPQTIASVLVRSQTYERAPYLDHRVYIDNGGDTLEKQVPWVDARDGDQGGYWWLDSQVSVVSCLSRRHACRKEWGVTQERAAGSFKQAWMRCCWPCAYKASLLTRPASASSASRYVCAPMGSHRNW